MKKDLEDSKKVSTFAARNEVNEGRDARREVLRVFELKKIFQKDLGVSIKVLTFAPLSAEKTAKVCGGGQKFRTPLQNKTCSYSNIKDSVL